MPLAVVYQLKNKDSDVFKIGIIPGEGSLYWDHIVTGKQIGRAHV